MSEFVHLGDFDGVSVSFTTAAPRPKVEQVPEPEIPAHIMENYLLNYELEAAYFNGFQRFARRYRGSSTAARKKFHSTDFKEREQIRREYFDELRAAVADIEAREPKPTEHEKNYEDAIFKFGGRFTGESQVVPGRKLEILQQT
jgi:hypothetical protein